MSGLIPANRAFEACLRPLTDTLEAGFPFWLDPEAEPDSRAGFTSTLNRLVVFFRLSGHARLQHLSQNMLAVANRRDSAGRACTHGVRGIPDLSRAVAILVSIGRMAGKIALSLSDATVNRDTCAFQAHEALAICLCEQITQTLAKGPHAVCARTLERTLFLYAFLNRADQDRFPWPEGVCSEPDQLARCRILLQLQDFTANLSDKGSAGTCNVHDAAMKRLATLLHNLFNEAQIACRLRQDDEHGLYLLSRALLQLQATLPFIARSGSGAKVRIPAVIQLRLWQLIRRCDADHEEARHFIFCVVFGLQQQLVELQAFPGDRLFEIFDTQPLRAISPLNGNDNANDRKNEREHDPARLDRRLIAALRTETKQHLKAVRAFLDTANRQGAQYRVHPDICTVLYSLSANLAITGYRPWHELADAFRVMTSIYMQQRIPPSPGMLALLDRYCSELTAAIEDGRNALMREMEMLGQQGLQQLLQLETGLVLEYAEGPIPGFRDSSDLASPVIPPTPQQLSESIRFLLTAESDLKAVFRQAWQSSVTAFDVFITLDTELDMLAMGAQELKIYRIQALARAMADLCDALINREGLSLDKGLQRLLLQSLRRLNTQLNQAAAHQEICSGRDLIARFYDRLAATSARHLPPPSTGLSLPDSPVREYQQLLTQMEALEEDGDMELLACLHSLKGTASLHGHQALAGFCHQAEECLRSCLALGARGRGGESVNSAGVQAVLAARLSTIREEINRLGPLGVSEARAEAPPSLTGLTLAERSPTEILDGRAVCLQGMELNYLLELVHTAQACSRQVWRNAPESSNARLQESCLHVLQTRLGNVLKGTVGEISPRLGRLARQLANRLDLDMEFYCSGSGILLPRTLLDYLQSPLEHLVRNAVLHGLEPAATRLDRGKPEMGRILLRVSKGKKHLTLELSDDGAGIDDSLLLSTARRNGIRTADRLTDAERLRCLLLPGFTTAEECTLDAGRGIGLTAVNAAVTALGGTLGLRSTAGRGCRFRLNLPRMLLG